MPFSQDAMIFVMDGVAIFKTNPLHWRELAGGGGSGIWREGGSLNNRPTHTTLLNDYLRCSIAHSHPSSYSHPSN